MHGILRGGPSDGTLWPDAQDLRLIRVVDSGSGDAVTHLYRRSETTYLSFDPSTDAVFFDYVYDRPGEVTA